MKLRATIVAVVAALQTGCFATRADLNLLLEQQKQLALRLSRMQDHLADLTLRVQELRTDVREVRGEMVQVDQAQEPLQQEVEDLKKRLAGVEQQDRVGERMASFQAERLRAEAMTLNSPQQMYDVAVSSYAAAETDRALALLAEVQRKWPKDPYAIGAMVRQGMIYAQQAMYLEAIDTLLKVIEQYPGSSWTPEAYLTLGTMLIGIEQLETGQQLLNDLFKFFPDSPEALAGQEWLARREAERQAALAAAAAAAAATMTTTDATGLPPTAPTEITAALESTGATASTAPSPFPTMTAPEAAKASTSAASDSTGPAPAPVSAPRENAATMTPPATSAVPATAATPASATASGAP